MKAIPIPTLQLLVLDSVDSEFHTHVNEETEIMIITQGTADAIINFKSYRLEAGDIIFLTHYQPHQYLNSENVRAYGFIFGNASFRKYLEFFSNNMPSSPILKGLYHSAKFDSIIESLEYDIEHSKLDQSTIFAYTQLIIERLIKNIETTNFVYNKKKDFLKHAQSYCIQHYREDINLTKIAERAGVHPKYLSAAFLKHFRMSIMKYVSFLRIHDACNLLNTTTQSISTIAFAVGFNSIRSFNREFKNETSMTPHQYRTLNTKDKTKSDKQ